MFAYEAFKKMTVRHSSARNTIKTVFIILFDFYNFEIITD